MYILHNIEKNLKLGWVHIPRTGGSSFDHLVTDWCKTHDNIKIIRYPPHCYISELGNRDLTFVTVRNPWDRMYSLYGLFKRSYENRERLYIKGLKIIDGNYPSFKHWIVHLHEFRYGRIGDPALPYAHTPTDSQCDFIRGQDPEIICRFENLIPDMTKILDLIGIDVPYPHENATVHDHYSTYYDDETREIVTELFKEDIDRWNYSFDTV